jgi:CHAD domain-containing protein
MQSCLWQIERNADGVATSTDPEWIHQMRIGVRRLREPAQLDVFVTSTLPDFADAVARGARPALRPTLDALASRTATARREARKHARAAVTSARFVRLVLAAGALRAQTGATRAGDLARDVARPLLKRRHQALIALGRNLVDAAPEERHAARLAAKKLRYATEFFASLFPRKKARAYRKSLAVLQEELGAWNDAATAARIAADVTGPESAAAAAFDGWAAARGASRRDALQASWSRFTEARPFW